MALKNQISLLMCGALIICILTGCVTRPHTGLVLATVDGEPVSERDLEYALEVAHRKEKLSSADALDLSEYVGKLVDDRLIVQEARRMGLDKTPAMQKQIRSYMVRESVVRLRKEEILRNISVTEQEIAEYYKLNFEQFTLDMIEADSVDDAERFLADLKQGLDFTTLAQDYHPSRKGQKVLTPRNMVESLRSAVSALKPGEYSGVVSIQSHFVVAKVVNRQEAPAEEFEKNRKSIESALREQKDKARSAEYLKELRTRASIRIDRELLAMINDAAENASREDWLKDERPMAQVNDAVLTVKDFAEAAKPPYSEEAKDRIVQTWIDLTVIDQEALSRHYETSPELANMLNRYTNLLLINAFVNKAIIPELKLKDEILKEWYSVNRSRFRRPALVKIQKITFKTKEEAGQGMDSLRSGADFTWLTKKKQGEDLNMGSAQWQPLSGLPENVQKAVESLKPGEISPIIEQDSAFSILRLQEKTEDTYEEFSAVKEPVFRMWLEEQVTSLLKKYADELKTQAEVRINEEGVSTLEKRLKKAFAPQSN